MNLLKKILILYVSTILIPKGYSQRINQDSVSILVYITNGVNKGEGLHNKDANLLPSMKVRIDSVLVEGYSIEKGFPEFEEKDTISVNENGRQVKRMNFSNIYRIKFPSTENLEVILKRLSRNNNVLFAQEEFNEVVVEIEPDEESCGTCFYDLQSHLNNTTNPQWDINAREAWNISRGRSGRLVGIFDTGVQTTHADLSGKVSGETTYDGSHGTSMAGIVGAKTDNNLGVAGINWMAGLYSKRTSSSNSTMYNNLVNMGSNNSLDVINNSYSYATSPNNGADNYVIKEGFAFAYKNDKVLVASAGNHQGTEPYQKQYPASWDEYIISVAAGGGTHNTTRTASSRNPSVDITAPGTDVYTTTLNTYFPSDGTSPASAVVSGIASLLRGMRPELCADDIRQIIYNSAVDINNPSDPDLNQGWDQGSGHGLVNAESALKLLMEPNELAFGVAMGGAVYSQGPIELVTFLGVTGQPDGAYYVRKNEIRRTITIQGGNTTPIVWGRGYHSNGYADMNPQFGTPFTEVVSQNGNQVTLRSFVYEGFIFTGTSFLFTGWTPFSPSQVEFAWAELYKYPGTNFYSGFENGLENAYNSTTDNIDWTIRSGPTPSSSTGPSSAYEGSNYIYVEASSPNFPTKIARLHFPGFNGLGKYNVQFKYHMYGTAMGSLQVKYIKGNGTNVNSTTISGNQGNQWNSFNATYENLSELILEATTGTSFTSDIAIDDIQITRVPDYPVDWVDQVNVNVDGSSLVKTSTAVWWDTGAASSNIIPAFTDGWIETKITDDQTDFMIGLSYTNDDHQWNTIDFNLYVSKYNGNKIRVYNRGSLLFTGPSYKVGDVVGIFRDLNIIYFMKNGVPFYQTSNVISNSLIADICLYNPNLTLHDVRMSHGPSMMSVSSSFTALELANQFDEVFGDPKLLTRRPVGNDHPTDTVNFHIPNILPDLFSSIIVFPNKSAGKFNITYTLTKESPLEIMVKDLNSNSLNTVYQANIDDVKLSGEFQVDISHLKNGIYLLEINNGIQKEVFRIVKSE